MNQATDDIADLDTSQPPGPAVEWTPDRISYAMLMLCAGGFHRWEPDHRHPRCYVCADCDAGLAPLR